MTSILEGEGAEGRAGTLALREDREATCFVSTPGEVLHIVRVVRVELKEKYVTLQTSKEERYSFGYDDVLGFKLVAAAQQGVRDRHAGFSR